MPSPACTAFMPSGEQDLRPPHNRAMVPVSVIEHEPGPWVQSLVVTAPDPNKHGVDEMAMPVNLRICLRCGQVYTPTDQLELLRERYGDD